MGVDDERWDRLLIRRGEIWLVDLDPSRGSEAAKIRPAVVVSNDGANDRAYRLGRGVITIVPITSNVERIYSFQVRLDSGISGLRRESKAQAEQIRSIAVERVDRRLGTLPAPVLHELDEAIRLHLTL